MVTEVNQTHRGVRCTVCHQPIPLSAAAARKDKDEKNQIPSVDDHSVKAFTLRSERAIEKGFTYPKMWWILRERQLLELESRE